MISRPFQIGSLPIYLVISTIKHVSQRPQTRTLKAATWATKIQSTYWSSRQLVTELLTDPDTNHRLMTHCDNSFNDFRCLCSELTPVALVRCRKQVTDKSCNSWRCKHGWPASRRTQAENCQRHPQDSQSQRAGPFNRGVTEGWLGLGVSRACGLSVWEHYLCNYEHLLRECTHVPPRFMPSCSPTRQAEHVKWSADWRPSSSLRASMQATGNNSLAFLCGNF